MDPKQSHLSVDLSEMFDTVCGVMEARGHSRAAVTDYLWALWNIDPVKLRAAALLSPDHFEQGFWNWYEQGNRMWEQQQKMWRRENANKPRRF